MARKSKVVSVSNEPVEVVVVTQPVVSEVIDCGPVEEVDEQSSGPSLMSQLVQQVVESETKVQEAKVKAEKNEGVGQFIRNLISEGLNNKAILAIVHEQYGNTNTTYACVAWYRNKMKKSGQEVKKASNLDWLQNFAKTNGLSEDAVQELTRKVA